jgi:hypothetical protein
MHDTILKSSSGGKVHLRPADGACIPIPGTPPQFSGGLLGIDLT